MSMSWLSDRLKYFAESAQRGQIMSEIWEVELHVRFPREKNGLSASYSTANVSRGIIGLIKWLQLDFILCLDIEFRVRASTHFL